MNKNQFNSLRPGDKVQLNKNGFENIIDEVVNTIEGFIDCRNTGCWKFEEVELN